MGEELKVCLRCGEPFSRPKGLATSLWNARKFCSRPCIFGQGLSGGKCVCTACGDELPFTVEFFPPNKSCAAGLETRCRGCKNASSRIYYEANKAEHAQRVGNWKKSNPDKWQQVMERRETRLSVAEGSHTTSEWSALCARFANKCLCCGLSGKALTKDHILPLTRGGSDNIDNLQPLCQSCNSRKSGKTIDYRPLW